MTEPPLLAIMAGRTARPRRAPRVRPRELSLHLAVADLLSPVKLKRMGLQRGWPDFLLLRPARGGARGLLYCLELKRLGEDLTDGQDAFRQWCDANTVPYAVAYSIDEALAILSEWRCLRIDVGVVQTTTSAEDYQPDTPGGGAT